MFSLQDANIHNIAVEGVFDDCQDIVKAVSQRPRVQAPLQDRHRQLDQLGAAAGAGRLLLRRLLPGHEVERRAGQLRRALGQLRQHLRRPRGAHDGPADRAPGAGDQRERRARRVLPHRHLPRARQRRDARDLEPVDGHLQGHRTSSASCSTCSAATARARARCSATSSARRAPSRSRPAEFARIAELRLRLRQQHARRPPGDDPRHLRSAAASIDRHPHRRRPEGGARAPASPACR